MDGAAVSMNWLEEDESAMTEPIIVEKPDGLDMKMPSSSFTVRDVAELVGEDLPIEVIGWPNLFPTFSIYSLQRRRCLAIHFTGLDCRQMGSILHGQIASGEDMQRHIPRSLGNTVSRYDSTPKDSS